MKKLILFAAILFVGVSVVKGEVSTPAGETGNKTSVLTVKLAPFQHIDVSGEALIEYTKQGDYKEGVVVQQKSSNVLVKVSSAGGFTVKVIAEDLKEVDKQDHTLSAAHIAVLATAIAESHANSIERVSNLKEGGSLIKSETGGMDIGYNVKFEASGADLYRQTYNSGSTQTGTQTYTTTLTYSIVAS